MKIKKNNKISIIWGICIVLVYGLLMATYFDYVNKTKISFQEIENPIYSYISTFNFFITILIVYSVWLISSFLFHLFAYLLSGNFDVDFRCFIKYTSILYLFPALGFLICIYLFSNINLPYDNTLEFLETSEIMYSIGWIINISSLLAFILVIPIIKKLHRTGWLESFGSFIIPIGLIYILSELFSGSIF